eukprot:351683-Chlamydomonas_euryale.AAC.4
MLLGRGALRGRGRATEPFKLRKIEWSICGDSWGPDVREAAEIPHRVTAREGRAGQLVSGVGVAAHSGGRPLRTAASAASPSLAFTPLQPFGAACRRAPRISFHAREDLKEGRGGGRQRCCACAGCRRKRG